MKHLQTPTELPLPFFSCPTLSPLETQIAEFGEMKESKLDYSLKKRSVLAFGKEGKVNNKLSWPKGLSLDEPYLLMYIVDSANESIQVVSMTGKFLTRFGQGILRSPWGIAIGEDNVYVTDVGLNALLQFNRKGYKLVRRTGTKGAGEGQLNNPRGLCTDSNGDVYVAEYMNNRVFVFSEYLDFLINFGTQQLILPSDVKVTPNNVVVLDKSPNCIHFFSRSGTLLRWCVTQGVSSLLFEVSVLVNFQT